jgi:hypothetical protein
MEHSPASETFTNLANGRRVVVKSQAIDKDLHVTDNGDGTLTVVWDAAKRFTHTSHTSEAESDGPTDQREGR